MFYRGQEQLFASNMSHLPGHPAGFANVDPSSNNLHSWSHDVPNQMPWSVPTPGVQQNYMTFTGGQHGFPTQIPSPTVSPSLAPVVGPSLINPIHQPMYELPVQSQQYIPTRVLVEQPCQQPSFPVQTAPLSTWPFTSSAAQQSPDSEVFPPRRCSTKRSNSSSSDEDDDLSDLQPPTKQYASADRVAAKLSGLSLNKKSSSTTTSVTKQGKSVQVIEIEELTDEDEQFADFDSDGVIELSDEVQSYIQGSMATDHLVNEIIKNELQKPSKALIPWTPQTCRLPCAPPIIEPADDEDSSNCKPSPVNGSTSVSGGVIIQEMPDGSDPSNIMSSSPIIQEDDDLDDCLELMDEDV